MRPQLEVLSVDVTRLADDELEALAVMAETAAGSQRSAGRRAFYESLAGQARAAQFARWLRWVEFVEGTGFPSWAVCVATLPEVPDDSPE